ncbi:hypothetical protein [Paraburkholderia heleia]|uniref:hypothetical protein n=1 Tax=Paraburkholderia heleia TaxID=634127 RepID=UPI0031D4E611
MALKADLEGEVSKIFRAAWEERDGIVVPGDASLKLGNDGINLEAAVLYADLADSTDMVDKQPPKLAAEVYKAFLYSAAKVIRSEGGEITAYDGDRIMAVYIGDYKNSAAARSALRINWAVKSIVQPALEGVMNFRPDLVPWRNEKTQTLPNGCIG